MLFLTIFLIPIVIENAKLKLELAIPTGNPITVESNAIDIPPLVANKRLKDLSK